MINLLILGTIAVLCVLMLGFAALLGRIDPHAARYLDPENTTFRAKFKQVRWAVIAFPVVGALTMGYLEQDDRQYSDLETQAEVAQPFYVTGKLRSTSGKRPQAVLKYDGGERAISCRPGESVACARRLNLPADVRVKLFDYRGWWIILELRTADGKVVLDEPSLQKGRRWYSAYVLQHGFTDGALFGLLVGGEFALFMVGIAALGALQSKRLLKAADPQNGFTTTR